MDLNAYYTVQNIWNQVSGEAVALEGYSAFLNKFSSNLDGSDIAVIREIMEDEMNHALKLQAMASKYSRMKPSKDDLNEALSRLAAAA